MLSPPESGTDVSPDSRRDPIPDPIAYALVMEFCNCSYPELISTYTFSQITILSTGFAELYNRRNKEFNNSSGKKPEKKKSKLPKPVSKMTMQEYQASLNMQMARVNRG